MRVLNWTWPCLLLLLSSTAAAQDTAPGNPGPSAAAGGDGEAGWGDTYRQIRPGALEHALRVIENSTGGKVLEIRLLHRRGPGFEAVVAMGKQLVNVRVRSLDDQVTRIAVQETPRWMLDWALRAEMRDVRTAQRTPEDAIRKVEQVTGAPAIDAALARPLSTSNGVLAYNIEVVKNGRPQRLAVDANTDEIIADPDAVLGPWTPERLAQQDQRQPRG